VGCHTDAYEQAKWLGDDMAVKSDAHYAYDFGHVGPATAFMLKHIGGAGRPLLERARVTIGFVGDGRRALEALAENHHLATPELVDTFCAQAPMLFSDLDTATSWDLVIDAEPSLGPMLGADRLDDALEAIGEFAELKSAWRMGHSRGVAELAEAAARTVGLPDDDVVSLRRSALVHDIGHLGVSNTIWDKRSELTRSEWERVRL